MRDGHLFMFVSEFSSFHSLLLRHHSSVLGTATRACRLCFAILGVVMVIVFLSAGGSSTRKSNETKNVRNGQATRPTTTAISSTPSVKENSDSTASRGDLSKEDNNANYQGDEKTLKETLETVAEKVDDAAEDQLEKNEQGLLSKALNSMESGIKTSVAKLLGDDASETAIDQLTQEVEGALVNNAKEELQQRAHTIAAQESDGILSQVEKGKATEREVHAAEADTLLNVRDKVDNAALEIRQHLRERAAQVEKSIMEKRLSQRLGRPIKLMIVDGDVEYAPAPPVTR
jgi:hypothetical protein